MKNKENKRRPFLLIELLHTFSKRELADFSAFVNCHFFNTDAYVAALSKVLISEVIHKKDFGEAVQCAVYEEVFPEKAKPGKVLKTQQKAFLNTKMNLLTRLAEDFLCHGALKENAACKTELLYGKLLERNQFRLFNRQVVRDRKLLEAQAAKGVAEYAHQFKMELGQLNYLHRRGQILTEDNLPELMEQLDIYYLLNKLNLHGTALALTRVTAKKSYDYRSMKAIQTLLDLPEYRGHPLIHIHRLAIDLLETSDFKTYQQLLELLEEHKPLIPVNDLNNFYKIAINVCGDKIREGQVEFYQHAFDLYRIMDSEDLLKEGNFMPVTKLKNIVTLCCRLNEFDWAKETIEKYRPVLEKDHANSVYHFNLGLVAFYQNDFKTALSHFIRVEKVNLAYDIDCRVLLLKSHYELDEEYDERTMRTFLMAERFIKGRKLLVLKDKRAYRNFIRLLMNLYRVRHRASRITAARLVGKLEAYDLISDKRWLLDKIGEL